MVIWVGLNFLLFMDLRKYIPFQLVLWLVLGIIIAFTFPSNTALNWVVFAGVLGLIIGLYWYKNRLNNCRFMLSIGFAVVFMGLGYLRTSLSDPRVNLNHYSHHIQGLNQLALTFIEENKTNASFHTYTASVNSINGLPATGIIKVNIPIDTTRSFPNIGTKVSVLAPLDQIALPTNPHQFNYRAFLQQKGIFHQAFLSNSSLKITGESGQFLLWAAKFRKKIITQLAGKGFKGDELAVINALLLGQRSDLSPELIENYQNAGAIHILAVSGLHVGILLLVLRFILQPLQFLHHGKTLHLVGILLGLWSFALLAGMSASIVRATTMFTAVAMGLAYRQRINTYQSLAIALFFLLLFRPTYLNDVGFQLSFMAVFFIVWLQPKLAARYKPQHSLLRYFWQLLTVSLAAQLGVLPLSLYYFHQFPGLFFISNLLIIPLVGTLLILGIVTIVLGMLNVLPPLFVSGYSLLLSLMNGIVTWVGKQSYFVFDQIPFNQIAVILAYIALIALVKWTVVNSPKWLRIGLLAVCLFQLNYLYAHHASASQQWIVFNVHRETLVGVQQGTQLKVFASNPTSLKSNTILETYLTGSYRTLEQKIPLKNVFHHDQKTLIILDEDAIYPINAPPHPILLLSHSPSLNLERIIDRVQPDQIIVDGSNYPSEVAQWEKTCKSHNIKFHYTVRDGAFLLQL